MRILAVASVSIALAACGRAGGSVRLATAEDSVSYIIGYQLGSDLKRRSIAANADAVYRGAREGLAGDSAAMSEDQMRATMMAYAQKMMDHGRVADSASAAGNTREAEQFLAANRTKEGVQTTASGLQYKVLREGSGPRAQISSTATVHYKGTLLNGKQFDSSYDRNQPYVTPVTDVIRGWTEGLQLMNAGAKYQFWIPADLAYGPGGSPPDIGPNAALVFEVELISFK